MHSPFYIMLIYSLAFLLAATPALAGDENVRWADWLKRLESRASIHRTFEKRLSELRAERRRLQLSAHSNRAYDLQGEHGADYSRQVYENVIAQAKLMLERAKALEQPL